MSQWCQLPGSLLGASNFEQKPTHPRLSLQHPKSEQKTNIRKLFAKLFASKPQWLACGPGLSRRQGEPCDSVLPQLTTTVWTVWPQQVSVSTNTLELLYCYMIYMYIYYIIQFTWLGIVIIYTWLSQVILIPFSIHIVYVCIIYVSCAVDAANGCFWCQVAASRGCPLVRRDVLKTTSRLVKST